MKESYKRPLLGGESRVLILALLSVVAVTVITWHKVFCFPFYYPDAMFLSITNTYVTEHASDPSDYFTLWHMTRNLLEIDSPTIRFLFPALSYITYKLCGTNPVYCYALTLSIYTATCVGILLLFKTLFKDLTLATSCSMLYSVSYLNTYSLVTGSVAYAYSMAVLLAVAAMVVYLYYPVSRKITIISCLLYFLSLQAKQSAILMPVALFFMCKYLNRQPRLRDFYPFAIVFFLYCLAMLLNYLFWFGSHESIIRGQDDLEKFGFFGMILHNLHWNLIYALYPNNLGNIDVFSYAKGHLWAMTILVFYILVKDTEVRRRINLLFLCVIIFLSIYLVVGRGLTSRYFSLALVFTFPITYTVISETLARILPKKIPLQQAIMLVIAIIISCNYISTQKILTQKLETSKLRFRDLEAGKMLTPLEKLHVHIEPGFMSTSVWWDDNDFAIMLKYYNIHK